MADQIRGLSIEIGLGTAKLDSGLKDLRKTMSAVNSEMKSKLSVFDRGEKSVDKYQTRIDSLNKKLEVQKAMVEKTEKAYQKAVETHKEGSKEADDAARAYNEEVAAMNNLQRSIDNTTAELKEFERQQQIASSGWTKMGDKMKDIGGKMKAVGSGMQDVGKKMTLGITAPIVGLGVASVKASMDFESAFAGVNVLPSLLVIAG